MTIRFPASLSLQKMQLSVRLGAEAPERSSPQIVSVDIEFLFSRLPEACGDDDAAFLCYHKLAGYLDASVQGREFKLIEYLTVFLHGKVRMFLKEQLAALAKDIYVSLRLSKHPPSMPVPVECAEFFYTDAPVR